MPVVVVRQPDGSLQGFRNVCRHRGGRIEPEAPPDMVDDLSCRKPTSGGQPKSWASGTAICWSAATRPKSPLR